jgi:hypothetical protein
VINALILLGIGKVDYELVKPSYDPVCFGKKVVPNDNGKNSVVFEFKAITKDGYSSVRNSNPDDQTIYATPRKTSPMPTVLEEISVSGSASIASDVDFSRQSGHSCRSIHSC